MKEFKITEEQIKELAKGNSKVKKWFPEVFEENHKIGVWYKHDAGNLFNVTDIDSCGSLYGYGFFDGQFKEYYNENEINFNCACNSVAKQYTILATEEEVLEALKTEAIKRGFKEGVYFSSLDGYKINHSIGELDFWLEENNLRITAPKKEWASRNGEGCSNPAIFKNGTWATIIETLTKEEA